MWHNLSTGLVHNTRSWHVSHSFFYSKVFWLFVCLFYMSLALAATVADFENVPPMKALMARSVWPVLIIQCQFEPPIKSLLSANWLIYVGAINVSEMKITLNQYLWSVFVRVCACVF